MYRPFYETSQTGPYRLIHVYPAAKSEAKVFYKESLFVDEYKLFMAVFIGESQVEENSASECNCTIAATYDCKILQLYEYDANEYRYEKICK